jgi:hypothetical protein
MHTLYIHTTHTYTLHADTMKHTISYHVHTVCIHTPQHRHHIIHTHTLVSYHTRKHTTYTHNTTHTYTPHTNTPYLPYHTQTSYHITRTPHSIPPTHHTTHTSHHTHTTTHSIPYVLYHVPKYTHGIVCIFFPGFTHVRKWHHFVPSKWNPKPASCPLSTTPHRSKSCQSPPPHSLHVLKLLMSPCLQSHYTGLSTHISPPSGSVQIIIFRPVLTSSLHAAWQPE